MARSSDKPKLRESLRAYFNKKWGEAIQHVLTGVGSSAFLFHAIHYLDKVKAGDSFAILTMILIGLIPLVIDFIRFHRTNQKELELKLNALRKTIKDLNNEDRKNTTNLRLEAVAYQRLENEMKLLRDISNAKQINVGYFNLIQNCISELETICLTKVLCENNLQKIESVLVRLGREKNYIADINEGHLRIDSFQNYEYVREIFGRILGKIMHKGDQYITLSSLGFWTRQPFLTDEGCEWYINKNIAEVARGKFIKRIIVIDEKLLRSDREIESLNFEHYRMFEENSLLTSLDGANYRIKKIEELKSQKQSLIKLIGKLRKYSNFIDNNYRSEILTLFYTVNIQRLYELRPYLATLIVVPADFKHVMFVKTKGLATAPETNAEIDFSYCKLVTPIAINDPMRYDVKQIIQLLNADGVVIVSPPAVRNREEPIDPDNFVKAYNSVFGLLEIENSSVKNTHQILDTREVGRRLGLQHLEE